MRLSDYIIMQCEKYGIKDAFMVTGGGSMHLNDSIFRSNEIKCHFFHHEQAAAIAAEGYARINNNPVLLNVTSGPGGVNAINGVYGAFVDSLPMLILSGQVRSDTLSITQSDSIRQLGDQEIDIVPMIKNVTKFSKLILLPTEIFESLEIALYLMKNGRPGPVWLDIPIDIQSSQIKLPSRKINRFYTQKFLDSISVNKTVIQEFKTDSKSNVNRKIDLLINNINNSLRPIILVGNGIRYSETKSLLNLFLDNHDIPVVTAWNAHDLISDSNTKYIGRPGTVGDRMGNFAVQNSDFVIILGCRLNIRQISYNWKQFAPIAKKAMVDIDLNELNKSTLSIDIKIHTNLSIFFDLLLKKSNKIKKNSNHIQFLNNLILIKKKYSIIGKYQNRNSIINPYFFIEKLFHKIQDNSAVVCGNGSACVISFQVAKIKSNQRVFTNSGAASMGYDIPAAIGASIALKNKHRVYCIAGDGSIMMNIQEMETVSFKKLNIGIIVINNNGYSSIRQTQKNYFPDRIRGVSSDSGLSFPSFSKISTAFGIKSRLLSNPKSIIKDLVWITSGSGPKLLEVIVDENQDFEPKLRSKMDSFGKMSTPELDDMFPFLSPDELRSVRNFLNGKKDYYI